MDNRHFEILMGAIDKLDSKLDRKLDKIDERIGAQDDEISAIASRVSSYENQVKGAWKATSFLGALVSAIVTTIFAFFKP